MAEQMTDQAKTAPERALLTGGGSRWENHPCACSFGKSVNDKNPHNFPRVGMVDNVIYRGRWMIRHTGTDRLAVISRPGAGSLCSEASTCCPEWFTEGVHQ